MALCHIINPAPNTNTASHSRNHKFFQVSPTVGFSTENHRTSWKTHHWPLRISWQKWQKSNEKFAAHDFETVFFNTQKFQEKKLPKLQLYNSPTFLSMPWTPNPIFCCRCWKLIAKCSRLGVSSLDNRNKKPPDGLRGKGHSLKLTASLPLKMGWFLEATKSFWGKRPILRSELLVSGR